jgi:rRNA-processing protein FCF1
VRAIEAGRLTAPVIVVLEGAAKKGATEGESDGLRVVHASHDGDQAIVDTAAAAIEVGQAVTVVTADRELRDRVAAAGAETVGPTWLHDRFRSK